MTRVPGSAKGDGSVALYTWTPVTNADTCAPLSFPEANDKCFQVSGTFGSATVVLKGSLDGTTYFGLRDASSTAISLSSADGKVVLENTVYVQPTLSGGDGTQSLKIMLLVHMNNPLRT